MLINALKRFELIFQVFFYEYFWGNFIKMNPQPTIFISSSVIEFYDLRGALRYFFNKNGFRVFMSEEPDFGVDCNSDALPLCKERIENSDYFILILGYNTGGIFDSGNGETTVTIEEFRHLMELHEEGKRINFFFFVRQQMWEDYMHSRVDKVSPILNSFITEVLQSTKSTLNRWRYCFDRFSDIITVLETNQNGLFLDLTRKQLLYKEYISKEVIEIYRMFFSKNGQELKSLFDIISLPNISFGSDPLAYKPITREVAGQIAAMVSMFQNKTLLINKIQRVFTYIAQGEFSYFNNDQEKYNQPEFIKLTIQTCEILEKVIYNTGTKVYTDVINRFIASNHSINEMEYDFFVKQTYFDLKTVFSKLTNLIIYFQSSSEDLPSRSDDFYTYRGTAYDRISNKELIDYSFAYFK